MDDDKKKYPQVKLPGFPIPISIVPDEDCMKADVFVALEKTTFDKNPAGYCAGTAGGYYCQVCNQEVVLAPSGQQFAARGLVPTCMECALKIMESQKVEGES